MTTASVNTPVKTIHLFASAYDAAARARFGRDFVLHYGADDTGDTDITALLKEALEYGGELYIPDGDYLIASAGADAGGVQATVTKSLRVTCGPAARFFTDSTGLDNDMVRIAVPSTGTGLPTNGIDIVWRGGRFDQSAQKVSTVVPFIAEYPPVKAGVSATCDGLSLRGSYNDGSEKNGFKLVEVSGVTFYAGTHWESAGGDSGLFCDGFEAVSAHGNICIGSRDAGIYVSGGATGVASGRVVLRGNVMRNCFNALAVKRSLAGVSVCDNTTHNCVLGIFLAHIVGDGNSEVLVSGNANYGSQVEIRCDLVSNAAIRDNHGYNFGAMRADGTTAVVAYTPTALQLDGLSYSVVEGNSTLSANAAYIAGNPWYMTLGAYEVDGDSPVYPSNYNRVAHNLSKGFRAIGGEAAGEADFNQFEDNYEFTGAVPNIQVDGANSAVRRYDFATGRPAYETPLLFLDGSLSVPIIGRNGDPTTGLFFLTNLIGFTRPLVYSRTAPAAAGTNQATATELPASGEVVRLTTVNAGEGVRLPVADTTNGSIRRVIINDTAEDLLVYPAVGDRIMPAAVDIPNNQLAGTAVTYIVGVTGRWYLV